MIVQPHVDTSAVHPVVWLFAGMIAMRHRSATGKPMLITSMRRQSSPYPSRHVIGPSGFVQAFDISRHPFADDASARAFVDFLNDRYDSLSVLLEPEDLSDTLREMTQLVPGAGRCIHVSVVKLEWPASL